MTSEPRKVLVRDVMTKKVISVSSDTSIFEAAKIISEHNFDGLPVIDENNHLIGIVTEYDLMTRTSTVDVSFMEKILNDVYGKKNDQASNEVDAKEISALKVSDIMNKEPLTLRDDSKFEDVIAVFVAHHRVNPIPIVNSDNQVVGIISRFDILRPFNLLGYSKHKK